jgi:hypothetical protein
VIPLGTVVRLQVQTANLKVGAGAAQRFDNRPLVAVPALDLDSGGVRGIGEGGKRLADIHHRDHPESKLRGDINPISFGFTGHYELMRGMFGPHMVNGAAGENILIDLDGRTGMDDVRNGLWVEGESGLVHLDGVSVAAPCAPFSRWALQFPDDQRPDERVTGALRFLNDGMRGYYCRLDGPPARIALGATVYVSA